MEATAEMACVCVLDGAALGPAPVGGGKSGGAGNLLHAPQAAHVSWMTWVCGLKAVGEEKGRKKSRFSS